LKVYLIANDYDYAGTVNGYQIAKSLAGTTLWTIDTVAGAIGNDLTKNNRTGFTALPGGRRGSSGFADAGSAGDWWSSKEDNADAGFWNMLCGNSRLNNSYYTKYYGFSIRCVKDGERIINPDETYNLIIDYKYWSNLVGYEPVPPRFDKNGFAAVSSSGGHNLIDMKGNTVYTCKGNCQNLYNVNYSFKKY